MVICNRFGNEYLPAHISRCRELIKHLSRSKRYGANLQDVNGAWRSDQRYWRVVAESSSEIKSVLELIGVCWLDMAAEFIVPNGVWFAYVRARVRARTATTHLYTGRAVELEAKANHAPQYAPPCKAFIVVPENENTSDTFHLFQLAMPIIVNTSQGRDTVQVRLFETSDHWKNGLMIDYFELRPASREISMQWRAWIHNCQLNQSIPGAFVPAYPQVLHSNEVIILPDPNRSKSTNTQYISTNYSIGSNSSDNDSSDTTTDDELL